MKKQSKNTLLQVLPVSNVIYTIRGKRVMLDEDLAKIYGVETKVLNQAIRRNKERFPVDFMFQLTVEEFSNLKSQIVTSRWGG
ncbi:MAG: ORF6N domain-containing protein, partial [Candidatus Gracilibacteria bacterium]